MTLFLAALALACGTATSSSTSTTTLTAAEGVALTVSGDGTYAVTVDGEAWLSSGPLGFTSGGVQYSSGSTAAPLKLSGSPKHSSGKDVLGAYEETLLQWVGGTTTMLTAFRAYTATPVLVFEQSFPEGFTTGPAPDCEGQEACKGAKITLSTAFPSWKMQGDAELSCFAGSSQSTNHGPWNGGHFGGGVSGGAPLVLFKQEGGKVAAASQQQQQQQRGAAATAAGLCLCRWHGRRWRRRRHYRDRSSACRLLLHRTRCGGALRGHWRCGGRRGRRSAAAAPVQVRALLVLHHCLGA